MRARLCILALAVGCSGRTGVQIDVVAAGALAVDQLEVVATIDGATVHERTRAVAPSLALPQTLLVIVPPATRTASFDIVGLYHGAPVADGQTGALTIARDKIVRAQVMLGGTAGDLGAAADLATAPPDAATTTDLAGQPAVMLRAVATAFTAAAAAPLAITVNTPTGTRAGDFLVGEIAVGSTGSAAMPTITPPGGWALVDRLDQANNTTLAIYTHSAGAAEPPANTWICNQQCEGTAFIAAFAGVAATPVDAHRGKLDGASATSYVTAGVTTTTTNALVIATFASHAPSPSVWTTPAGMTTLVSFNNADTRSMMTATSVAGPSGAMAPVTATVASAQDYALMHVLALAHGP